MAFLSDDSDAEEIAQDLQAIKKNTKSPPSTNIAAVLAERERLCEARPQADKPAQVVTTGDQDTAQVVMGCQSAEDKSPANASKDLPKDKTPAKHIKEGLKVSKKSKRMTIGQRYQRAVKMRLIINKARRERLGKNKKSYGRSGMRPVDKQGSERNLNEAGALVEEQLTGRKNC